MDLRLRTRQVGGAIVVEVGGEVELHSAPQLREELLRVCEAEKPCIVVDLSGVSFIDSTGLGVLINIANQGLFDTPLMFVALATLAIIGLVFYGLVVIVERRLLSH